MLWVVHILHGELMVYMKCQVVNIGRMMVYMRRIVVNIGRHGARVGLAVPRDDSKKTSVLNLSI